MTADVSNFFPNIPQNFSTPPGLYVAATPIGCVADISVRTIIMLQKARVILAENIGTSKKLLGLLQIKTNAHWIHFTEHQNPESVLEQYRQNPDIFVLISEAGTAAVNDPGVRLVHAFRQAVLPVFTLPGPSSVIAAWSVSGWEGNWMYLGFLPKKEAEVKQLIEHTQTFPLWGSAKTTTIFCALESPHRIEATLRFFDQYRPGKEVMVLRELSKHYESYYCALPENLLQSDVLSELKKGELVFMWKRDLSVGQEVNLKLAEAEKISENLLKQVIQTLKDSQLKPKEKAKKLAQFSTGVSAQEVYSWFNSEH